MFERNINVEDVEQVLASGTTLRSIRPTTLCQAA
ncbi:MAG: hypothetical protein K1X67_17910 [Fimbriimonadaceae bacterium]|nr:hypothetical protein [Fimbriimonadaceae bacterium]